MRAGDPSAAPSPSPASRPQPGHDAGIGERTLKIEAARTGVTAREYLARLSREVLCCYRCRDWHDAGAFPADSRRHSGRAGSCRNAVRAAAMEELAGRGQLPSPAAVWIVKRPGAALQPHDLQGLGILAQALPARPDGRGQHGHMVTSP